MRVAVKLEQRKERRKEPSALYVIRASVKNGSLESQVVNSRDFTCHATRDRDVNVEMYLRYLISCEPPSALYQLCVGDVEGSGVQFCG